MAKSPIALPEKYWEEFLIQEEDLEFLYNHLLEIETPLTPEELIKALILERIRSEKELMQDPKNIGAIYFPKDHFELGQEIAFPNLNWQKGKVLSVRAGNNPELAPFEVMEVELENGVHKQIAAGFENHRLNDVSLFQTKDDPNLNLEYVLKHYGIIIVKRLSESLEANPDLVRIAGKWFPRSLLVDVNIGYLNLAEALLEMEGGGPLSTQSILEQIELPTDVNLKLTEFSLNLALQEDGRFDEVGPAGKIQWFLKRLEPEDVINTPRVLKYSPINYDSSPIASLTDLLCGNVCDELEPQFCEKCETDEISISLIYPHWRAGTLPLVGQTTKLFPTAYESPRVMFTFIDGNTGSKFSGWVVFSGRYVCGLKEWYQSQEVFPGAKVQIQRSDKPGEVIIKVDKRRTTRDWVRTALIGADGGMVFAMLRQPIQVGYDERMEIVISDPDAVDKLWELQGKQKGTLEDTTVSAMRSLSKLNPQGHVHFLELYSAVNLFRRCPPGPLLSMLVSRPWASYLGDLYFRQEDKFQEG
jgi:hypothetical protein